jgi:hypothetical protein
METIEFIILLESPVPAGASPDDAMLTAGDIS